MESLPSEIVGMIKDRLDPVSYCRILLASWFFHHPSDKFRKLGKMKEHCETLIQQAKKSGLTHNNVSSVYNMIERIQKYEDKLRPGLQWHEKYNPNTGVEDNDRCCVCGEWAALKGCAHRYNMIQNPTFTERPIYYEYVDFSGPESPQPSVAYLCDPCLDHIEEYFLNHDENHRVND